MTDKEKIQYLRSAVATAQLYFTMAMTRGQPGTTVNDHDLDILYSMFMDRAEKAMEVSK